MLTQAPIQNAPLTQVTLTLHQPILEQAERYAKAHNTDISRMVEEYFSSFLGQNNISENNELSDNPTTNAPLTQKMAGMFKDVDDGRDYKTLLQEAREEKFLWLKNFS